MKLVEILARELHEWPDGQLWASQDPDREVRFDSDTIRDFYASTLADDAGLRIGGGARVTREMWEAERAKSAPWFASEPACCHCIEMDVEFPTVSIGVGAACSPEWDGEGLPPVGLPCELRMVSGLWMKVTPTAYGKKHMLFEDGLGEERIEYISEVQARPLRTPEQVAAEKREREINELVETIICHYEYPKGAESYIGLARALHNAGYRKQEKDQ